MDELNRDNEKLHAQLLAKENERIVAVTAAMPEGTGLAEFAQKYPDRCFDVGIAEQHGVTFAAGLATEGMQPVIAIYSTFLQRAYDQILHDVCLERLPVIFAIDRGGIVGEDGSFRHVIGVSVLWDTPVGPLRFNFSDALKKETYDREQSFELTLSTRF